MALAPGPLTFSRDRLRTLWRGLEPVRLRSYYNVAHSYPESKQDQQQSPAARKICLDLYSCVKDPRVHLDELDLSFGSINCRPFLRNTLSESAVSFPLPVWLFHSMQHIFLRPVCY